MNQLSDSRRAKRPRLGGELPPHPYRDFSVRTATALTMGAVQLASIIWGGPVAWAVVTAATAVLCASELYAFTRSEHRKPNEVFGLIAVAAMPVVAALYAMSNPVSATALGRAQAGAIGLAGVVGMLGVAALLWHLAFRQITTADTAVTVFGAVYVGFSLSHLVLLDLLENGQMFVIATLVSVWANDVLAYAVGGAIGRTRLAPEISPKKSWEGLAAGTLGTVGVWVGTYYLIQSPLPLWWHVLIGVAVSAGAVAGDLFESRLKREAGVKDSGRLMPGHGGFLDRFDSMILVSVLTFYLIVFGLSLFGARA